VGFEDEVATVREVDLGVGSVAGEGQCAFGAEDFVVAQPIGAP
jgi:hypothetical protein